MTKQFTDRVHLAITPKLRRRLEQEAVRRRRNLSSTVRVMLEEALELCEPLNPSSEERLECEILLTVEEAVHLTSRGYRLIRNSS